ncbi:hypothetical protein KCP71_17540 [Salmonella enterica subsp. enterica]|nr:hypothetical protein KCP71_17540 [Salmonella enterica subsp. enterica]
MPSGLEVLYWVEDNQFDQPAAIAGRTGGADGYQVNQLTSLPPLPAGLQTPSVAGNQLTSLPPLPAGLARCCYKHVTN